MWENADHPVTYPRADAPARERAPKPPVGADSEKEAEASLPAPLRRRASRAQVETIRAVRRTAADAGFQLAQEQDDSVSHVAQTLAEINEDEDIAELDGRLTFAERQIDRIANRRDTADRLVDAELVVMRTRLDETLRAFAAATQEHKDAVAAAERRLLGLANEAERHTRAVLESLRVELSVKVEEASQATSHLEARLRGEKRAFEEEATRRLAALAGSIAAGRELLEERVETATERMELRLEGAAAELAARLADGSPADRVEFLDALAASEEKALGAAEHLESQIRQVRRRLVGDEAEWSAVVAEAGDAVTSLRVSVKELLSRTCALEADGARQRGASGAQLGGIEDRLVQHEERSEAAEAEVADQGLRIGAVEAQLGSLAGLRGLVDEQAGMIGYLQGRVHDLSTPPPAQPEAGPDPVEIMATRLDALAEGQRLMAKRLDELETRLAENHARRRVWS